MTKVLGYSSSHPQIIRLIASWILDFDFEIAIPITLDEVEEEEEVYPAESLYPIGLTMTIHHKYYSTKYLCESTHLTYEQKVAIMDKVFGSDSSDSTIRFRKLSVMRIPASDLKETIWKSVSDLETNTVSIQEYRHECQGFMIVPNHLDLIEPYFDKFYPKMEEMMKSNSISQAKANIFMTVMCPLLYRGDASKDLEKVKKLLQTADDLEKEGMSLSSYKNFFKE